MNLRLIKSIIIGVQIKGQTGVSSGREIILKRIVDTGSGYARGLRSRGHFHVWVIIRRKMGVSTIQYEL